MADRGEPLYYWEYLKLDQLLSCTQPITGGNGTPAHDEHLFILVHQAFELWFKQILFELERVLAVMSGPVVPDQQIGEVVRGLGRITVIQRVLTDQLEVLETMTPLDFLDFRDQLVPASGFQSVQFRLIENRLGLDPRVRLKIKGSPYTSVLRADHVQQLEESATEPSLFDHVERWLERTPFLRFGEFEFWRAYGDAVEAMLEADRRMISVHPNLDDEARAAHMAQLDNMASGFQALLDPERYERLRAQGHRRLSRQALLAALLISLYRDEPAFQAPFRLLTGLIDVDEGFAAWRYRHSLMARRMIGGKIGTGGTSGHDYLEAAARKHRIFTDLFDLPTFFLPRSALPALPHEVEEQLSFRYSGVRA